MIWMLANTKGDSMLATSNKSEAAMGYTTMDGDTSGGLAPIADVPKTLVTRWLTLGRRVPRMDRRAPRQRDARHRRAATTRCVADDEDDLMPFAVLDRLMHHFVALGQEPVACSRPSGRASRTIRKPAPRHSPPTSGASSR